MKETTQLNEQTIPNLRKIVYKKHNDKWIWTISVRGDEVSENGRVSRGKDKKYTGITLEEALLAIKS